MYAPFRLPLSARFGYFQPFVKFQVLLIDQDYQHVFDAIDRRRRSDDDLVPGSIGVRINSFDGADHQTLWVDSIKTRCDNCLARLYLFARRDVSQFAKVRVVAAHFAFYLTHRPRTLKHRAHAGVLVGDELYQRIVWAHTDHPAHDSTA